MKRVSLSFAAATDLEEIDDYTIEQFGLRQAIKLREQFRETFQTLLHSPSMAPFRRDYDPPGKTFRYFPALKRFTIVYDSVDNGIHVVRILHGGRDIAIQLERDAGDE